MIKNYTLNNGVTIPCIGYGTWKLQGEECYQAVRKAMDLGYRHVDTAVSYENEKMVGKAWKDSNVAREDIFITSKLPNKIGSYGDTMRSFEETLTALHTDYLDLYLIHWPAPLLFRQHYNERNIQVWKAMEDLYREGKVKAIGVSNFMIHHMESLLPYVDVIPMVNQIEIHPLYWDADMVMFCKERGILIEAFSPLARGNIIKNETMQVIASKYHRSVAQLCVNWCLHKQFLPLPKSTNADRMKENMNVFDFTLRELDMKKIDSLSEKDQRIISHPDFAAY